MAKQALIAEPDEDEAQKQAAILAEDGYNVTLLTEGDVFEALAVNPPDVVILRNERPGQKGLALVSRIKRHGIASASAIVLTTSELNPDAIEKHRSQKFPADAYVRLPVDRADLLAATASVPQVLETDELSVETLLPEPPPPQPPPLDPSRPPPLKKMPEPVQAQFRPMAVRSQRQSGAPGGPLTDADIAFVEDVFGRIQAKNINLSIPIPTEIPTGLSGPERKFAVVEKALRERERDLARLMKIWQERQSEIEQAAAEFAQKDIEVGGLRLRITELNAELDDDRQKNEKQIADLGRTVGEQYDEQALAQAEMIQEVAKKETEINRLKRQLREAGDAAAKDTQEMSARIFQWEEAYNTIDQYRKDGLRAVGLELDRVRALLSRRGTRVAELLFAIAAQREDVARARLELQQMGFARDAEAVQHRKELAQVLHHADALLLRERTARQAADDDNAEMRAALYDLQVATYAQARLLARMQRRRWRSLSQLASLERARASEQRRLLDERNDLARRFAEQERAFAWHRGEAEAALSHLLTREARANRFARAEQKHRDGLIQTLRLDLDDVRADFAQSSQKLNALTTAHATEHARAEALEQEMLAARRAQEEEHAHFLQEERAHVEGSARHAKRLDEITAKLAAHQSQSGSELARLQAQIAGQQAVSEEQAATIKALTADLKEQTRTAEMHHDLAANHEQTIAKRDATVADLGEKIRAVDGKNVALEGQNERLTTEVAQLRAELDAATEQQMDLAGRLAERDQMLDQANAALTARADALTSAGSSLKEQEAGRQRVKAALDLSTAETRQLRAELAAQQKAMTTNDEEKVALSQIIGESRAEMAAQAGIIEQLQQDVILARELAQTQHAHGQAQEQVLLEATSHSEALQASLDQLLAQEQSQSAALQESEAALTALREEMSVQSKVLSQATADAESAQTQAEQQQAEWQELRAQFRATQETLTALGTERDEMRMLAEGREEDLEVAARDKARMANVIQTHASQLESARTELAVAQAELVRLKTHVASSSEELKGLQQAREEASEAKGGMEKQLLAAQATVESYQERLAAQAAKASDMEEQLLRRQLRIEQRETQLSEVKKQLVALQQQADLAAQARQESEQHLAALKQTLAQKEAEVVQGKAAVEAQQAELERLKAQANDVTDALQAERQARDEERRHADAAKGDFAQHAQRVAELTDACSDAKLQIAELERLVEEKSRFIESRETRLAAAATELAAEKEATHVVAQDARQGATKAATLTTEIGQLREQLEDSRAQKQLLDTAHQALQKRSEQLTALARTKTGQVHQLEEQLAATTKDLDRLATAATDLEAAQAARQQQHEKLKKAIAIGKKAGLDARAATEALQGIKALLEAEKLARQRAQAEADRLRPLGVADDIESVQDVDDRAHLRAALSDTEARLSALSDQYDVAQAQMGALQAELLKTRRALLAAKGAPDAAASANVSENDSANAPANAPSDDPNKKAGA